MKKVMLFVLLLAVISGGLFAQANLVLFENGQWNAAVGKVTMTGLEGSDRANASIAKFENGVYVTTMGFRFDFEKPIDASAYRYMTIETEETRGGMAHWAGGAIFIYHATAFEHTKTVLQASPTNIAHYGFWDMGVDRGIIKSGDGGIVFDFKSSRMNREVVGKGDVFRSPDLKNLAGFRVKRGASGNGTITIKRITLHN